MVKEGDSYEESEEERFARVQRERAAAIQTMKADLQEYAAEIEEIRITKAENRQRRERKLKYILLTLFAAFVLEGSVVLYSCLVLLTGGSLWFVLIGVLSVIAAYFTYTAGNFFAFIKALNAGEVFAPPEVPEIGIETDVDREYFQLLREHYSVYDAKGLRRQRSRAT